MSMTAPVFALVNGGFTYLYTSSLDLKRYEVNRRDVTQSWTDANWIEHRQRVRTRVTGTVHLGFKSKTNFDTFLTRLSAGRNADGYNSVKVLVLNSGAVETINAFLTVTDGARWNIRNEKEWHDVTIKIEER